MVQKSSQYSGDDQASNRLPPLATPHIQWEAPDDRIVTFHWPSCERRVGFVIRTLFPSFSWIYIFIFYFYNCI